MSPNHNHHISTEIQLQAEQQVEAFIAILSRRYGVDEDEIPELISGIRWALDHRRSLGSINTAALVALATTVVGGLLLALWEGTKALIRKETGGAG